MRNVFINIGICILFVTLLAGIITVVITHKNEGFTEFYLLGTGTNTDQYPEQMVAYKASTFNVGISNQENYNQEYKITASINGKICGTIPDVEVLSGETQQLKLEIIPNEIGLFKISIALYLKGADEPIFEPLRLWVEVLSTDAQ